MSERSILNRIKYHTKIGNSKLTPIKYTGTQTKSRNPIFLMQCDCGQKKRINLSAVLVGRIKSCGCLWKPKIR